MSHEAAVRAQLAAEAEKVMNESKPTPTQAEVDAVMTGTMGVDDKEEDENPSMRPLHEQHAMIHEARKADQKSATADEEHPALYRTRVAAPVVPRRPPSVEHNAPASGEKKPD